MDTPYLLISLPQLDDALFARSVVLIIEQDSEGSFGLILNKPMLSDDDSHAQMVAEVKDVEGKTLYEFEEELFHGGPVNQDNLYALHNVEELSDQSESISENLYLTKDPETFQLLLENPDYQKRRRFFLGCSTWQKGQLEMEMRTGAWVVLPCDAEDQFQQMLDPDNTESWSDDYWKATLAQGGMNPFTLMGQGPIDRGYN